MAAWPWSLLAYALWMGFWSKFELRLGPSKGGTTIKKLAVCFWSLLSRLLYFFSFFGPKETNLADWRLQFSELVETNGEVGNVGKDSRNR